jgi:hypothetical protein
MSDVWKGFLRRQIDEEFRDCSDAAESGSYGSVAAELAAHLSLHQDLARQTFNAIVLAIKRSAPTSPSTTVSVARRVSSQLLAQIGQDITAINTLTSVGLVYQAASIAASTFEHAMMLASIGDDNARAQLWLDHTNQKQNIDSVKDRVRAALEMLDRKNPGLKGQLGDPYAGMYGPLCTFKHGNPLVQQYLGAVKQGNAIQFVVFPMADRRAVIAGCWAIEAANSVGLDRPCVLCWQPCSQHRRIPRDN